LSLTVIHRSEEQITGQVMTSYGRSTSSRLFVWTTPVILWYLYSLEQVPYGYCIRGEKQVLYIIRRQIK
jgi:hypothetical protein